MEISDDDIKNYFDKFIKPNLKEIIMRSMLLPYLPMETLEEMYKECPEAVESLRTLKKENGIA